MMGRSLKILRNSKYLIFSIILYSNCTNSPKKDTSATGTGNEANSNISDVGRVSGDKKKPHVYTISISDMKFHPEEIEVHKGDTVIWVNHDLVEHCVTEIHNKLWTSSEINPGGSWKMEVTQSSDYYCVIHQVMKGKIVME
jgi:plastocyanin